jgi:DNA polymerase III psi subunit
MDLTDPDVKFVVLADIDDSTNTLVNNIIKSTLLNTEKEVILFTKFDHPLSKLMYMFPNAFFWATYKAMKAMAPNIDLTGYQSFHLGSHEFLITDDLEKLGKDKALKRALWEVLKQKFVK